MALMYLQPSQAYAEIEIEELSHLYLGKWVVTRNDEQLEVNVSCDGGSSNIPPGIVMLEPPVAGEYKVTGLDPAGFYLLSIQEEHDLTNGGPVNMWWGGSYGYDSMDFTDGEAIIHICPGFGSYGGGTVPTDGQYSTNLEIQVITFF